MFPSLSVAQRKEKRGNGKRNNSHPIFSKPLAHLEYRVIAQSGSSLSGRMSIRNSRRQQPAGATVCSGSETRAVLREEARVSSSHLACICAHSKDI